MPEWTWVRQGGATAYTYWTDPYTTSVKLNFQGTNLTSTLDVSGNNSHAVLKPTVATGPVRIIECTNTDTTIEYGYDFDGSDDRMVLTNAAAVALNLSTNQGFTIAVWVNNSTFGSNIGGDQRIGRIIRKETRYDWFMSDAYAGYTRTMGIVGGVYASNNVLSSNTWQHLAWTCTGAISKIFVNAKNSSGNLAQTLGAVNGNNITIGNYSDQATTSRFYNGYMDDFRVYKRALTATELNTLMTNTYPYAPSGNREQR